MSNYTNLIRSINEEADLCRRFRRAAATLWSEAADALEAQAHKLQIADERSTSDALVINAQRVIIYARDNTIKTQTREIEALKAHNQLLADANKELRDTHDLDHCQIEALRADAERYRWLREPRPHGTAAAGKPEDVDTAVDAARRTAGTP